MAQQRALEIFDVVNDRDEVIGSAPRNEVHRLGLMHRATHVLVFNSRGELFLQKRSQKKDRQPGLWDSSASGHVDKGETYDACAARELKEELGLDHFEGRHWLGWHHHVTLVTLAYAFLRAEQARLKKNDWCDLASGPAETPEPPD